MTKKWYSYFVVNDEPTTPASPAPDSPPRPPRRAGDLAPEASAPAPSPPPAGTAPSADLSIVYESAQIVPPAHGYTVLKVAEMLQSEHIRALPAEVRRKSVLVALDAAGVKVEDIVEDAVRRDRALDTYERVLQKRLDELAATTAARERADRGRDRRPRRPSCAPASTRTPARSPPSRPSCGPGASRKQAEEALIADGRRALRVGKPDHGRARRGRAQGDADVR